jgi:ribonuclease BN (tRNA processing enzyme)
MTPRRLSITVLGSGGPVADPHRVSAGYVLWIDGKPRILLDAGGGTFERIGRSGLDVSSLEQILLTHMHIDHTSDLPAIIMHLYMCDRKEPIAVTGPTGRPRNDAAAQNASPQPGAIEFVRLLFGPDGAWRYMNTFEGFGINVREISSTPSDPTVHSVPVDGVLADLGISIHAVGVPHGMMPAVAFLDRLRRLSNSLRIVPCSFTIVPCQNGTCRMEICTQSLPLSAKPRNKVVLKYFFCPTSCQRSRMRSEKLSRSYDGSTAVELKSRVILRPTN